MDRYGEGANTRYEYIAHYKMKTPGRPTEAVLYKQVGSNGRRGDQVEKFSQQKSARDSFYAKILNE